MNYIGIDISLNSTAIYIENKEKKTILSFTNKKENNIYIRELSKHGVIFHHHKREVSDDYSKNEILKIKHYSIITNLIIIEILKAININEKTYCVIEGYSYSQNTSSIVDIVALSSLIRYELLNNINDIDIEILSPSTLKLESCKLVYKPIEKIIGGKKPRIEYIYKNNQGIPGGSFKKPDMYRAMFDGNIDSPILPMIKIYESLMFRKNIPNPIEDIIDSIFACKVKINKLKNDIR